MGKKLYLTNGVSFGGKYTITANDVAVAGVAEVVKLTFTSGCTVNGNISVSLRGATAVTTAVTTTADTPEEVATLVQAGTYTGWTATVSGAIVTFTATVAGAKTGTNTLTVNSTGVVGTFAVTTTGTNTVDGSVTFDCSSTYTEGTAVDYDMVAAITVLTSANVFVPLVDAVITYPANGQIKIADGSTFKLTAGYIVNIVAQRANTVTA